MSGILPWAVVNSTVEAYNKSVFNSSYFVTLHSACYKPTCKYSFSNLLALISVIISFQRIIQDFLPFHHQLVLKHDTAVGNLPDCWGRREAGSTRLAVNLGKLIQKGGTILWKLMQRINIKWNCVECLVFLVVLWLRGAYTWAANVSRVPIVPLRWAGPFTLIQYHKHSISATEKHF